MTLTGQVKDLFDRLDNIESIAFEALVDQYGRGVIDIAIKLLSEYKVKPSIVAEVLILLGDLDDEVTYEKRVELLTDNLASESSRIREGAILGLCRIKGLHAKVALEEALANEPYEFLQGYIKQALEIINKELS
jgi:HEAT repeat protein